MVDRSANHLCKEHNTQIRDCRLDIELAYFVAHTCRPGTQAASFLCTSGFNMSSDLYIELLMTEAAVHAHLDRFLMLVQPHLHLAWHICRVALQPFFGTSGVQFMLSIFGNLFYHGYNIS